MERAELKSILEALLFVSDSPLTTNKLKEVMGRTGIKEIKAALAELKEEYRHTRRSFTLSEVAEGYQLSTLPQYSDWIRRLYKGRLTARLSKPALETLAIIAFKQPITRPDIEALRGVDVGGVLSTLLERKLVAISGRDPGPGKPLIYITTKDFLQYFGLNKLSELPRPRELEELLKEREQEQTELFGDDPGVVPEESAPEQTETEQQALSDTEDQPRADDPDESEDIEENSS